MKSEEGTDSVAPDPAASPLLAMVGLARTCARSSFAPVEDATWLASWSELWRRAQASESGPVWLELNAAIGSEMSRFDQLGKSDRSRLVARMLRAGAQIAAAAPLPKAPRPIVASHFAAPLPERSPSRSPLTKRRAAAAPTPSKSASPSPEASAKTVTEEREPASKAPSYAPDDARTWPVRELNGVGPKLAQRLMERGLATLGDLAFFLPSSYVDRRQGASATPEEGQHGVVTGVVRNFRQSYFGGRYQGVVTLDLEENGEINGKVAEGRWFHRVGGLEQRFLPGQRVTLAGMIRSYRGQLSLVHPEVVSGDDELAAIGVHYPAQPGLSNLFLRKLCRAALEVLQREGFIDPLPSEVAPHLPGLFAALRFLHEPPDELDAEEFRGLATRSTAAHQRLAFDEFVYVQLAYLRTRQTYVSSRCALSPLVAEPTFRETLRAALPFEPTPAQWQAIADLERDFASGQPMLRLLQGDVGAGKTVVAFAAACLCASAGGQSAIMAPTELLAMQHLRTLTAWCEKTGLKIALLTGSLRRAERATLLALLAARQIDVLVGTHALLVDDVVFAKLGLVVVDEQHRFGVEQRARLRDKGEAPHLLVMTATPIPRTLALAAYGELELSVMRGLPPGRTPPVTKLYAGSTALPKARTRLIAAVGKGVQAFVVCPLVQASETLDVSDVEATAAALREAMPDTVIELVHGRMSVADKDHAMQRFRSGEARILVATTVIEVGVDVPNARVMLVEHAERFGLAQLHQLRGRVGRGEGASLCLLHTANGPSSAAGQRLRVLEANHDGFAVAEADLEVRGPGEVFGTKQAGLPRLRFASFGREGLETLTMAREAAAALLKKDPQLQRHPEVVRELERRLALGMVFSNDAG